MGPGNVAELPKGKEADGIIGDFILRNDKVEAVISGNLPLRRANMSTFYGNTGITPGCVYDLTLRGANNDQIVIYSPAAQQGKVSWVRIAKDGSDGEAVIETVVTAAGNDGLFKRHEYKLRDGWQGVLVTTTVKNEGKVPKALSVEDRWTNFNRSGKFGGITWADAVDPADRAGYAYGVFAAAGETASAPVPVLENPGSIQLAPGQGVTFSRMLAVGNSPGEAIGIVASMRGTTGTLAGTLSSRDGAPVTTGHLMVRKKGEPLVTSFYAYPDREGKFSFRLPEGEYEVGVADVGRASVMRGVSIKNEQTTRLDEAMTGAAAVVFDIRDESGKGIPCKVQFHGIGETRNPNLGPANRAHGCMDQYFSEKGQFRVAVPPGKYRVIVTRGIEHSHLAREVAVGPESTVSFAGELKRLVDTKGWVSADYHNHSTPSGDNVTGTDDRIISLAAENVEFAPTTEHNRIYDWRPHIEKLGLAEHLQTVIGIENTGNVTHFNAFPFKIEPNTQDNGAPVWNPDPRITAIQLRDWQAADPDRWIQINHPDMVRNFIDRDRDGRADGGFIGLAELIDGIEVQNFSDSKILTRVPFTITKNAAGREQVTYSREFIWLQMLNRGHRYAAMAVCDAHSIYGNGVGGWRMYMPSKTDNPAEIDWRENSRHAKAGRSILTTGPFLQVNTEDGTGPGGFSRSTGGTKLHVKVQCTDWIDIDRVQVLVNGAQAPELNFTRKTHPEWFMNGVVKFDRMIDVPLAEDAHLIVVAYGENSNLSVGYGTSNQGRIRPCAFNNPIFIDANGNGFTPNGDMLGWPLPSRVISVEEAKRVLAAQNP